MNVELTYTRPQLEFLSDTNKFIIVTKGRRFGATKGFANYCIECMLEGIYPLLWVDTINGNIDRYFERYFAPELKKNKIEYDFNQQKKVLKIRNSYMDFRSADAPHSIEGFGYRKIFLNEAGIILANKYLYTNSILPMLMDYPESQLLCAGVPKGKYLSNGDEHPFYTLYQRAKENTPNYALYEYTSYDNPLLRENDVHELENEIKAMSELMVQQEIYGKFIEYSENNPFFYNYKDNFVHTVDIVSFSQIIFCFDFNINPFCCLVIQSDFNTYCNVIDEIIIENGSIDTMVDSVRSKYWKYLNTCLVTGDAMGKARNISVKNNYSNYQMLERGLGLRGMQVKVVANPTHDNSRADCNYFLAHFPKIKIDPKCENFIRDLKYIQVDVSGKIKKDNRSNVTQRADLGDCFRYFVNTFVKNWIEKHRKLLTLQKVRV